MIRFAGFNFFGLLNCETTLRQYFSLAKTDYTESMEMECMHVWLFASPDKK